MEKNGVPLLSVNFAHNIDSALASGFLTAIAGFGQELVISDQPPSNKFSQMGQKGGIFWIFDGKNVRLALLLDDEPTKEFKMPNWDLLKRFETVFEKQLEEFTGLVEVFNAAIPLLDEHLHIYYLAPMLIHKQNLAEPNVADIQLVSILEDHLENFGVETTIDIHQLINRSFKELKTLSHDEILYQIIYFVENKILLPQTEKSHHDISY